MEIVNKILEKEYITNEEKEFLDKINSEKLTDIEKEEITKKFENKTKLKNNFFYKNFMYVINFFIFIFLITFGITCVIVFFQTSDYSLIIPFSIYIFILNYFGKKLYKKSFYIEGKKMKIGFYGYYTYFRTLYILDKQERKKKGPSGWGKFFEILGLYLILRFIGNSIFKK